MRFFLILLPAVVLAQLSAQPPLKLGDVTVQGSVRSRLESWDWFGAGLDSEYTYSGTLVRISFSQQKRLFDWNLELAAPILLGLPTDAIGAGSIGQMGAGASYFAANGNRQNAAMIFPKQAYLRLKGMFGDDRQSIRLGRYEFLDGSEITPKNATLATLKQNRIAQRLIGNFGWTHVGRSLDGFHYVANGKKLNFTLLGGLPTRGVFQVDGWGNLKAAIGYASLNGALNRGANQAGDWRVFGMYYQDGREGVLKTDNRPVAIRRADTGNIRIGSAGGHYLHSATTTAGTFDFMAWGLLQTGTWGSLDHRASAGSIEGGWQPPVLRKLRPWVRAGYFAGSGDKDPNDSTHGTFFQVIPTPRPFARFPFFDLVNNRDAFGTITLRPSPKWTISSEVHNLRLSRASDLWFLGGGAFQPWTFGYTGRPSGNMKGLANLYDVSVDYKINPHYTVSGYLGCATGGDVIRTIYPQGRNGRLGYIEFTYKF
jgi:hypothetical protein